MHALGRYLQREMDQRGWKTSDLVRRSGLSKQTVYNLINDTRQFMDQTPQRKTVNGLAEALGVDPIEILTASAQALGVPVEGAPASAGLGGVSDEQILHELSLRLAGTRSGHAADRDTEAGPGDRERPAGGGDAGEGQKTTAPVMWPADQFDLAAHPPMELERERFEREHGSAGEESQAGPDSD